MSSLRRLRQRVERAGMDARGHEVVARAFGRRLDQDRRLDLEEAALVEVVAHRFDDAVAHGEVALHARPPQVEIAVAQAHVLVDVVVAGDDERRRQRAR